MYFMEAMNFSIAPFFYTTPLMAVTRLLAGEQREAPLIVHHPLVPSIEYGFFVTTTFLNIISPGLLPKLIISFFKQKILSILPPKRTFGYHDNSIRNC